MDYGEYRDRLLARFPSPSLAFAVEEYETRLSTLRAEMDRRGFDMLMLTDPAELCYLTGYTTFEVSVQCVLLVGAQRTVLFVPAIEVGPAVYLSRVDEVVGYAWESPGSAAGLLADRVVAMTSAPSPRIGVSLWSNSLRPGLLDSLRATLADAQFQDKGDFLDIQRLVKSPAELDYLAESAAMTGAGLDAAFKVIHDGAIDHHIAQAGADAMLARGSEFMSMQPIVTTGFRSGIIHTSHVGSTVARGDVVFTEFGAVKRRYTAPMMRTAVVGPASAEIREFHEVCLAVLDAVMQAARTGEPFASAAIAGEAALAPIADRAFFSGVYGYPVGAQFPPSWVTGSTFIARDCDAVFEDDMVFHLPICLRKPGEWGVGFSETVRITATGAERITTNDLALQVFD
ncbi:M24 family metallopeptidase [Salinisphaera aquimarina]|uniref:M24 family metallopeptidase n=1 Tax=Salinisphaera aquimarina TaxID=2094031 RepID=A0ABV7ET09_9GAMM